MRILLFTVLTDLCVKVKAILDSETNPSITLTQKLQNNNFPERHRIVSCSQLRIFSFLQKQHIISTLLRIYKVLFALRNVIISPLAQKSMELSVFRAITIAILLHGATEFHFSLEPKGFPLLERIQCHICSETMSSQLQLYQSWYLFSFFMQKQDTMNHNQHYIISPRHHIAQISKFKAKKVLHQKKLSQQHSVKLS